MTEKSVYGKAVEYVGWCRLHGAAPRRHSKDTEESRLAGWFNSYRQAANCSSSVRRVSYSKVDEFLLKNLGEHAFDDHHAKCMAEAEKYVKFYEAHGRRPCASSGRLLEEELSNWFYKYRAACSGTIKRSTYDDVTNYMQSNLGSDVLSLKADRHV